MNEIQNLASAIATKEGWFATANDIPKEDNNPGDLRASPLDRTKPLGFVKFNSPQEGIATLYWQILFYALRGATARTCIQAWAPPTGADGGNDTAAYLADVQKWTGLDLDVPLWNYLKLENAYLGLSK